MCWIRGRDVKTFVHRWRECKVVQLLWKTVWSFQKTKHSITIKPSNSIPRHTPSKLKTETQTDTWMPMFREEYSE